VTFLSAGRNCNTSVTALMDPGSSEHKVARTQGRHFYSTAILTSNRSDFVLLCLYFIHSILLQGKFEYQ